MNKDFGVGERGKFQRIDRSHEGQTAGNQGQLMAKGKLEAGDEVELHVAIERVWPAGAITIFIKNASAGGRLTLLDDRDIITARRCAAALRQAPAACLAGSAWQGLLDQPHGVIKD
jgi:hypothetical protein